MTLTLSTYTYNDGVLVDGLLEHADAWTVQPDAIIITDDGSEAPYVPKREDPRVQLIRLPQNKGFTTAKSTGIGAAAAGNVLSLDCDIRLAPDWLEYALPHLEKPEVGLVAGSVERYTGKDLVSRYLNAFDSGDDLHESGTKAFVPGIVFMMRTQVWHEVGGFGTHSRRLCEDHALCNNLRAAGYVIHVDTRAVAFQTRKISRRAMCRRTLLWCGDFLSQKLLPGEKTIPYLFEMVAKPMLHRFERIVAWQEPLFAYLELLYMSLLVLWLLDHSPQANPALADGFRRRMLELLASRPRLRALLQDDLQRMGVSLQPKGEDDSEKWDDFFLFTDFLEQTRLLNWLERKGVLLLLEDERNTEYNFSSYAQLAAQPEGKEEL